MQSIEMLLDWDTETFLPDDAIPVRAEQKELMASLIHKQRTSAPFKKALSSLINLETGEILGKDLDSDQKACLKGWRRDYHHAKALPASFIKAEAHHIAQCSNIWSKAKKEDDFATFQPHLEKMVKLMQQRAEYLGYKNHPYDALLDLYEPEMGTKELDPLFKELKHPLIQIMKGQKVKDFPFLHGSFETKKQLEFSETITKAMGLSNKKTRLDLSSHPFCTGIHPNDVRMTTHITPSGCMQPLLAVMHEAGHGLYEMNLPEKHFGSPLCEYLSMGIHESQSKIWETCIGMSKEFWHYWFPKLQETFPDNFANVSLNEFCHSINQVKPSLIRIYADEVTYSLHVMLRYELEKGLIDGSIKVRDLPTLWNEKMHDLFGITPPSDQQGCLQDIHWSLGLFGYFPSYALGNLYSAQLFESMKKAHPDYKEQLQQGKLTFVTTWLKENVHQHGKRYTPKELIKHATGSELSAKPFLNYIKDKYAH